MPQPQIDTSKHPETCSCAACRWNGTGESGRLFVLGLRRCWPGDSRAIRQAIADHNQRYGQRGRAHV